MAGSNSNLIDIRMKLSGGRAVVSGLTGVRKGTEEVGKATSKTSKATKIATGTTGRLTTAYKELGTHAKLAFGLVGAGALFGVENAISKTEELSKSTSLLSRNLGFTTKAASEWGAVAQAREISTSALTMSFGSLSSKMVEAARKGGSLLTPFHQLGISQEEVAKGATNFNWGLARVAKSLGEETGGAKRSTAAKAVLGRGYKELLPLFSKGSEGLKEQLHWADEFGVTLSGKTNKGLEDMIEAQRKNKVAMLGLEVSMTKFLSPAIAKGDEALQSFIKTLNDPNMSAEQKVEKIGKQFQGLEKDIITVIEKALPKVAEESGRLGLVMAKAVGNAFLHANAVGKLAIAAYVFQLFGGKELAVAGARKAGGLIGTEMGLGLVTGAAGAFLAYELWNHLSKRSKEEVAHWAKQAGADFVNYFVREINKGLNEANPLGNLPFGLSVEAPQLGEVSGPGALGAEEIPGGSPAIVRGHHHGQPRGGTRGTPQEIREAERALEAIEAGRRKNRKKASPQSLTLHPAAFGGGNGTTHVHLYLARNDKEIASAVLGPAQRRAALK